jgi:methylphosphotriester-DNA--protein-cysteine methyltransferase
MLSATTTSLDAASSHRGSHDLARLRRMREPDRPRVRADVEARPRRTHVGRHFSREVKLAYGESPDAYLMTRRTERPMALLHRGDLSVTEVCFAVGCASLGTISTHFTEMLRVPPSVYRHQAVRPTAGCRRASRNR